MQATLKPLDVQQTKDIETAVAGIRADKVKEKTASDAAKKGEHLAMLRIASLNRLKSLLLHAFRGSGGCCIKVADLCLTMMYFAMPGSQAFPHRPDCADLRK